MIQFQSKLSNQFIAEIFFISLKFVNKYQHFLFICNKFVGISHRNCATAMHPIPCTLLHRAQRGRMQTPKKKLSTQLMVIKLKQYQQCRVLHVKRKSQFGVPIRRFVQVYTHILCIEDTKIATAKTKQNEIEITEIRFTRKQFRLIDNSVDIWIG